VNRGGGPTLAGGWETIRRSVSVRVRREGRCRRLAGGSPAWGIVGAPRVIRDASLFRPLFPAETHGAGRPPVAGPRQLQVMLGGRLSQAGKTVPSFGPAWRQAGSRACPPVAGSKCRWILSVPRPARLGGFPAPESRYPAVCRRLPFWQFPCPSACPPPASLWRVPAVRRCRCNSALRTPHSALRVAFSQQVIHNGVWPYVHVANRQIRVKIGQNGVKIGSKKVKKGAHFVMPILTFWGVTPSGASARAVLPLRKGHFGVLQGSKTACGKVIHKMWITTGNPPEAGRPRQRRQAGRLGNDRESGTPHWARSRFHKPARLPGNHEVPGLNHRTAPARCLPGMLSPLAQRMPTTPGPKKHPRRRGYARHRRETGGPNEYNTGG